MTYDSRPETLAHAERVRTLMMVLIDELTYRAVCHDWSKLLSPEVEVFDEFTPKLKELTYGSSEYKEALAAMGPALQHHYAKNSHHPEHHIDGIDGMTLVDLIEMIMDWRAATERSKDGDLARSLQIQKDRFGISDQLMRIISNTYRAHGLLE